MRNVPGLIYMANMFHRSIMIPPEVGPKLRDAKCCFSQLISIHSA